MLFDPYGYNTAFENNFVATPSVQNIGTTVTGSGSANTKGAYSALIATTTYDSFGFWLHSSNVSASGAITPVLLDIALGAAASEVDILANFMISGAPVNLTNGGTVVSHFIPLFIPKGSRVSARLQSTIISKTASVGISLNGGGDGPIPTFNCCDTYGADTAGSGGTTHTPGNSGAESTDATIGTATRDYGAVLLRAVNNDATVMTGLASHWELTVSNITLAEWWTGDNTSEVCFGMHPPAPIITPISNGTAMQVQAESSGTAQAYDACLYCFY